MANPAQEFHRVCPLCDEDDASELWRKESLRVVRCHRCAMVYADPVAEEFASGVFYDRLKFYLSPDKLEGDYAPVRFERELQLFRAFCRAGKVLDMGCSTGAFLYQLKTRFPGAYEVRGADVAGAALDYAESRGIAVLREPFLNFDFGGEQFDAVTFWAVMEHLVWPQKFLRKAAALLKPGGVCFILVPNLQSLAVRLLGSKYRYIMPDHVNYFTAATLKKFIGTESDWKIIAHGSTHFNPAVILKDFRGSTRRVPDEERARLLKRTTALKQSPWLRPLQLVYGGWERMLGALTLADNLFLVLRKK